MNYAYNYKNKNSEGFVEEINRIQEIKKYLFSNCLFICRRKK